MILREIVKWQSLLQENSEEIEQKYKIKKGDLRRQLETSEYLIRKLFGKDDHEVQLLADEVGMGKTYIALAVISWFINTNSGKKCLLITPQSNTLQKKWRQEIEEFNSRYMTKESTKMKPIVISDFGAFLRYAGHHSNKTLGKVKDEGYRRLFLEELWEWANENKIGKGRWSTWTQNAGIEGEDYGWYKLYNQVSANALKNYFSGIHPQTSFTNGRHLIARIGREDCESELNQTIRNFLQKQESYEPNVVIIKMNQLGPNRSDSLFSRELSTFILRTLLKGKKESNKRKVIHNIVKWEGNFLIQKEYFGEDRQRITDRFIRQVLGIGDYANVEETFEQSDKKQGWLEVWDRNVYPGILENRKHDQVKSFIRKTIAPEIIKNKIKQAAMGFCVVDEIHNWKSGSSNGAQFFKDSYSPAIPKKLIMSATPFQIYPPELKAILKVVCSDQKNPSYHTAAKLFGSSGENLFEKAIHQSRTFNEAWKGLSDENINVIEKVSDTSDAPVSNKISKLKGECICNPQLTDFLNQTTAYRQEITRLEKELSKIMVRHSREKEYRNYHCGCRYRPKRPEPIEPIQHQCRIYETKGYTSQQESQALLEFIAMRFDQLSRMTGEGQVNAHLLGGMTSSFSAFIESQDRKHKKLQGLSEEAQTYKDLIYRIARKQSQIEHSKVRLTRTRVLSNWDAGLKTLVFCYRTKTVEELCKVIVKDIEKEVKRQCDRLDFLDKWEQQPLKSEFFFKDDRLWRSFLYALSGQRDVQPRDLPLYQETKQFLKNKAFRSAFNKLMSRTDLHRVPAKRALRAIDLLCLRQFSDEFCKFLEVESSFLEPLFDLAEKFLKGGYLVFAKKSDLEKIGEVETEDTLLEVVDSKMHGLTLSELLASEGKIKGGELDKNKKYLKKYVDEACIWFPKKDIPVCPKIHNSWWHLIKAEIQHNENLETFFELRKLTLIGLRKMMLRKDLVARYLKNVHDKGRKARNYLDNITDGFYSKEVLGRISIAQRIADFLEALNSASGTINPSERTPSKRQSLWGGIYLRSQGQGNIRSPYIKRLDGGVNSESRSTICQAFNSPLLPDILICTCIGQEGIDLHQYCSDVIHHDLPWNPGLLEQRTGRIDRVNSLTERERRKTEREGRIGETPFFLEIGIPFLGNNYDQYQYDVLVERAQCFEILMGDSVIKKELEEYHDNIAMDELDDKSKSNEFQGRVIDKERGILPDWLVDHLKINLSIANGVDRDVGTEHG